MCGQIPACRRAPEAPSTDDNGQEHLVLGAGRTEHYHVKPGRAGPPVVRDDAEVEMDDVAIGRILGYLELEFVLVILRVKPLYQGIGALHVPGPDDIGIVDRELGIDAKDGRASLVHQADIGNLDVVGMHKYREEYYANKEVQVDESSHITLILNLLYQTANYFSCVADESLELKMNFQDGKIINDIGWPRSQLLHFTTDHFMISYVFFLIEKNYSIVPSIKN